jgi:hypothetical protein
MKNVFYDYVLGSHLASAIVNGDYSGLSDSEAEQLDQFIANLPNHYHYKTKQFKNLDLADYSEEPSFSRCEITGLHGDCLTFRLTYI